MTPPAADQVLEALTRLASADDTLEAFRQMDELCASLGDSISPYRGLVRALLARVGEVDRLRSVADRDELTGVGNRRGLHAAATREMARARRTGERVAVLVLDMDGLKSVNDEHGHEAGDRAIVELAQACELQLRDSDYLARSGGDEFVVILPNTDNVGARRVAHRIRRALAERSFPYGRLGVSIGYSASGDGESFTELIREADAALYRDKRGRKETAAWESEGKGGKSKRKMHAA